MPKVFAMAHAQIAPYQEPSRFGMLELVPQIDGGRDYAAGRFTHLSRVPHIQDCDFRPMPRNPDTQALILAACNVCSMLIMMTLERTRDIAILKAMGARQRSVTKIFILEGLGIALIGSILGVVVGFTFCELLLSHGISLDAKVYGIDHFPIVFNPWEYLFAVIGSLTLIGIAVMIPARRAGKLEATQGLREDQLNL